MAYWDIGKDTKADESIVHCEGAAYKVRSVKRVIPSKQWHIELHKSLNSTPWDQKRKHWFRTPAFNGCLRSCETTWTEEETAEMKTEEKKADDDDKESLRSLERQDTDVIGFQKWNGLDHLNGQLRTEDNLDAEDTREHKRQTVALISEIPRFTIGVICTATVDGDVPVSIH